MGPARHLPALAALLTRTVYCTYRLSGVAGTMSISVALVVYRPT